MRTHSGLRAARLLAAAGCAGLAAGCGAAAAQEPAGGPGDGLTAADLPPTASAARGRLVYERWCIGCHGPEGRGDGPAAAMLDPLPRDFQQGMFKFRTTPPGAFPSQDDLVRTITRGLAGSSMPSFALLPEVQRRDVAEYVIHQTLRGRAAAEVHGLRTEDGLSMDVIRDEWLPRIRERLAERRRGAVLMSVPPETPADDASVARGRALYAENCLACHGAAGVGDGTSSYALRDARDAPIRPRDLTSGVLRGGDAPRDVLCRLRTGLDGTPMPAFGLDDAALWDVVHFVMTLRPQAGSLEESR